MEKIITYNDLSRLIEQLRLRKKPLVLAGGCFDILHLGHVRFLNEIKKYGTLIVALESDEKVRKLKGENRPIHKQPHRAEVLAALNPVDYIILLPSFSTDEDYRKLIQTIKPTVIAVTGGDPQLSNKQKQAKAAGAKIIIIPKIHTPSTSQLAKLLDLD